MASASTFVNVDLFAFRIEKGNETVNEWDSSKGDIYARGYAMAHGAIIASLLRKLIEKGVLSKAEVEDNLNDIRLMFQQPLGTDAQMVAAGAALGILQNVSQASP
jgi:hypothetical protein